jgi:hypothetical protein
LGEIEFYLQGAKKFEVFFARYAKRSAYRWTDMPALLDGGREADLVHREAGVDTKGQRVARLAQLGINVRST